jgi:hypothetical protein
VWYPRRQAKKVVALKSFTPGKGTVQKSLVFLRQEGQTCYVFTLTSNLYNFTTLALICVQPDLEGNLSKALQFLLRKLVRRSRIRKVAT